MLAASLRPSFAADLNWTTMKTHWKKVALLGLLGIFLLAAFTGYLGPSHRVQQLEETHNRFVVLHCFVLPAISAHLLVVWFGLSLVRSK